MEVVGKTRRLRKSLENQLKIAADIPICYKGAMPTVRPPFGVYLLRLVRETDGIEQYELTLDVSGVGLQEDAVEEIADRIARHMDYLAYTDDCQSWECYLNSNQPIEEKDINVQRRRLSFEVRYMDRLEEV